MRYFLTILLYFLFLTFNFTVIAQIDTSLVIFSWKLDQYYIDKIPAELDTNLTGFQIDNPIYKNYISVTTLGNLSSPSISNIFTDRDIKEDYTVANVFYPFMKRIQNTYYFNTRKPFSKLTYYTGGGSYSKEETFDVFHSQNVNPLLNIGLHFTTQGAAGQYRLQRTKNNSFRLFSNRNGRIYSYHLSFNVNHIAANENGGVVNDTLITDTVYTLTKYVPTLFGGIDQTNRNQPDVFHDIRNISFFTIQELALRKKSTHEDTTASTKKIRLFYPKLAYILTIERTKVLYTDKNPSVGLNAGLYPDIYIDRSLTKDSLFYWKTQNTMRLQFQGRKNNHYFIDFSFEAMNYTQRVPSDTIVQYHFFYKDKSLPPVNRNAQLHNTYLSSGFSRIFANALKFNLYGRYYISGYQFSDFQLSGNIELMIKQGKNKYSIKGEASNEFFKPGFLYGKYISNNFIWNQSLKQTNISNLSGELNLSSKKFVLHADYYLFRNLIYFDTAAYPRQFQQGLSVLTVVAQKEFIVWKLHSLNKIAWQQVSNTDILSLPVLSIYSSNYLEHEFYFRATEGRLLAMLGFDLFYNTSYYANAYMPPLAVFYQQKEKQLGNYPYIDVFLNLKLKRVRFFVKYEHVNSGWIDRNFFTALHYPKNQRYLKLGISWTFYD
jgi:hypothetical protein